MSVPNLKYKKMWSLLEGDFADLKVDDLNCDICTNVLRNAYQSSCGCRYCFDCIVLYLDGEIKPCPNKIGECENPLIQFEMDIHMDHVANRKISMTMVDCPEQSCQFRDELRNIYNHIDSHRLKCPSIDVSSDQLIVDSVGKLRYELGLLKTDALKTELLHADMEEKLQIMKEMNKNRSKQLIYLLTEVSDFGNQRDNLKEQIRTTKDTLKSTRANQTQFRQTITQSEQRICKIKPTKCKQNDKLKKPNTTPKNKELGNTNKTSTVDKKSNSAEFDKFYRLGLFSQNRVIPKELTNQNYAPFHWKIGNLLYKRKYSQMQMNSFFLSDPFYSNKNGYKFCLVAYLNGFGSGRGKYLSVGFHIMQGEYNDMLSWPMKRGASISLVYPNTGISFRCEKYSYDKSDQTCQSSFGKPLADMNPSIGTLEFIDLSTLFSNQMLVANDSIVFTFSIGGI